MIIEKLITLIDLAFDRFGNFYVLVFAVSEQIIGPYRDRIGRLVRYKEKDISWANPEILVDQLPNPTSFLIGWRDLYIDQWGVHSRPGWENGSFHRTC